MKGFKPSMIPEIMEPKVGICVICILCYACSNIFAREYVVGGSFGWAPGFDYRYWTTGKNFVTGDILVFQYQEGYSVNEVSADDFMACDGTQAVLSSFDGNTKIALKTEGDHYFIGAAFDGCSEGMALVVNVTLTKFYVNF